MSQILTPWYFRETKEESGRSYNEYIIRRCGMLLQSLLFLSVLWTLMHYNCYLSHTTIHLHPPPILLCLSVIPFLTSREFSCLSSVLHSACPSFFWCRYEARRDGVLSYRQRTPVSWASCHTRQWDDGVWQVTAVAASSLCLRAFRSTSVICIRIIFPAALRWLKNRDRFISAPPNHLWRRSHKSRPAGRYFTRPADQSCFIFI